LEKKRKETLAALFSAIPAQLENMLPHSSLAEAIVCAVVLERAALVVNREDFFWQTVVASLERGLGDFFQRITKVYLASMAQRAKQAFEKFPRFVDKVVSLWDKAVGVTGTTKDRGTVFTSSTIQFANHMVGKMLVDIADGLFGFLDGSLKFKLECSFFYKSVMSERGGEALSTKHLTKARQLYQDALVLFAKAILLDSFQALCSFVSSLEDLLKDVDQDQIPFCKSRTDLVQVLQATNRETLLHGLHNAKQSISLLHVSEIHELVETELKEQLINTYARFEELVADCYGDIVTPALSEVRALV
jgi:hypothetical protein